MINTKQMFLTVCLHIFDWIGDINLTHRYLIGECFLFLWAKTLGSMNFTPTGIRVQFVLYNSCFEVKCMSILVNCRKKSKCDHAIRGCQSQLSSLHHPSMHGGAPSDTTSKWNWLILQTMWSVHTGDTRWINMQYIIFIDNICLISRQQKSISLLNFYFNKKTYVQHRQEYSFTICRYVCISSSFY